MPLFALPLAPSSTSSHSQPTNARPHSYPSLPIRKRKRRRDPFPDESSLSDNDAPPAFTNPLSLTPEEIAQYRLAGLELDEEVPGVKDFPHRGLGDVRVVERKKDRGKGKAKVGDIQGAKEEDGKQADKDVGEEIQAKRAERGPRLRLQHLSVLTTILQRCLLEGDIQRASRAWAMLVRAQVGGRGIDLRGSGYWGIGAELLVRSLDRKRHYSYDEESDSEEEEEGGVKRWGSAQGLEKTRDYYERLILQHPYKRQFDGSVSALDFWPAMVGCEIYGIQFKQNEGLRRIVQEEEEDEGGERSGSQSEESEDLEEDEEGVDPAFAADQRRKVRRTRRRAERRWIERDEIRRTALTASEKIAARMDELMTTPPYSDSHNLLRLRGMVALYVGDLSVPEMPTDDDQIDDDEDEERRWQRMNGDKDTERRFLYRQRVNDHKRGLQKRREEHERAKGLFERIAREGGSIEDIKDLPFGQDEAADEFYDAEE